MNGDGDRRCEADDEASLGAEGVGSDPLSDVLFTMIAAAVIALAALASRPIGGPGESAERARILRDSYMVDGQPTTPFHYHDKGIMATIGRNAAVCELPHGVVVKGRLGWLAWLGLHLWYLVGFRNRLRVLINWTWRYFYWPSGPRLIVADAETVD